MGQHQRYLKFTKKSLLGFFIIIAMGQVVLFRVLYHQLLRPLSIPYENNFTPEGLSPLRQHGGLWEKRNGVLTQYDSLGTDLFSTIPLKIEASQKYFFQTSFKTKSTWHGAGLLFNMQNPTVRAQSHMIRFGKSEKGRNYLVFGVFDNKGSFAGQGSVTLKNAPKDGYLRVEVADGTYSILFNDKVLKGNIPLKYHGGYPSLLTWKSKVSFDNVKIAGLQKKTLIAKSPKKPKISKPTQPLKTKKNTPKESAHKKNPKSTPKKTTKAVPFKRKYTPPTLTRKDLWVPVSGDWLIQNGKLVQQNPKGFDHTALTNKTYRNFEIRTKIDRKGCIGAGLLLFGNSVDQPKTGSLIRFFNQNGIGWGSFDKNGKFVGQGYKETEKPTGETVNLRVTAQDGLIKLFVNETQLMTWTAANPHTGHVGFTTSECVAHFYDIYIIEKK